MGFPIPVRRHLYIKSGPRSSPACPHLRCVFPHDLDHVGHGEVHDVVSPGQLQDHVWMQQVVACKQAGREALKVLLIKEPCDQLLRNLDVTRLTRVLHSILTNQRQHLITDFLPEVWLVQSGKKTFKARPLSSKWIKIIWIFFKDLSSSARFVMFRQKYKGSTYFRPNT